MNTLRRLRAEACETFAALSTYHAMRVGGPGIIVDMTALRGPNNHPNDKRQYATALIASTTGFACIFPDQSVVVGRNIGNNQAQLVSAIFKIRPRAYPNGNPVYHVARGNNPLVAQTNTKLEAYFQSYYTPKKKGTLICAQELDTQNNPNWAYFKTQITTQVDAIVATLDTAKWTVICDGFPPPSIVTPEMAEIQGFPSHAIGKKATAPDWLPHNAIDQSEKETLTAYCQDFLNWMKLTQPDLEKVSFYLHAQTPLSKHKKADFDVGVRSKQRAHDIDFIPPTYFLQDKAAWNPPLPSSLLSYQHATPASYAFTVIPDMLMDIVAQPVSAHEAMRLMAQFGHPTQG